MQGRICGNKIHDRIAEVIKELNIKADEQKWQNVKYVILATFIVALLSIVSTLYNNPIMESSAPLQNKYIPKIGKLEFPKDSAQFKWLKNNYKIDTVNIKLYSRELLNIENCPQLRKVSVTSSDDISLFLLKCYSINEIVCEENPKSVFIHLSGSSLPNLKTIQLPCKLLSLGLPGELHDSVNFRIIGNNGNVMYRDSVLWHNYGICYVNKNAPKYIHFPKGLNEDRITYKERVFYNIDKQKMDYAVDTLSTGDIHITLFKLTEFVYPKTNS